MIRLLRQKSTCKHMSQYMHALSCKLSAIKQDIQEMRVITYCEREVCTVQRRLRNLLGRATFGRSQRTEGTCQKTCKFAYCRDDSGTRVKSVRRPGFQCEQSATAVEVHYTLVNGASDPVKRIVIVLRHESEKLFDQIILLGSNCMRIIQCVQ